ncbi:MAG: hypothetical protein OSB43_05410 [Nocardioides sp.]|uniref:hypothetical protein n=1 Tax=Nocardioides sp. TaxID=35761 RepID=UPI002390711B|nr:hypothetical protein [Nocardioides sp.]MDE0775693.1 hypothetical protein [Nocardioides sp.]
MSISPGHPSLQIHPSTARTPVHASDAALLAGVRDGDDACAAELERRHAAAVSVLADDLGVDSIAGAWDRLLGDVRDGRAVLAPVRVRWLVDSLATRATTPVGGQDDDAVWAAFVQQPPAGQTAVWHALVEHDDAATVATLLGSAPEDARRSVTSAVVGLRRGVTLRHGTGVTAECDGLSQDFRGADQAVLGAKVVRRAREHGRHCDDCLPLIRAVFRVEHSLRDVLAARVLGAHAREYLRTRPGSRSLALAPRRVAGPALLARRAGGPALGALASGVAAAAVVSAFVVSTPDLGSTSTPDTAAPAQKQDLVGEPGAAVPGGATTPSDAPGDEQIALVAGTDVPAAPGGRNGRGPGGGAATDEVATALPAADPVPPEAVPAADPGPVAQPEPVSPPAQPDPDPDPTVPLPDPGTSNNAQPERAPVLGVDVEADQDTGSIGVTVDLPVAGLPSIVVVTPPIVPGGASGLLP